MQCVKFRAAEAKFKAGTIQQIAELAGVSRGTVDRALNNRGRINPEVAKQIWQIADEIGYVPKHQRKTVLMCRVPKESDFSDRFFIREKSFWCSSSFIHLLPVGISHIVAGQADERMCYG